MKLLALVLLGLAIPQTETTTPIVEHHSQSYTTTTDTVTHKCPDGYEGHYVDMRPGFEFDYGNPPDVTVFTDGYQEEAFTICFKKDFMDKIRKNPDMRSVRPLPPHGV